MAEVLISGAFPDRLNRNTDIRKSFAAGFREILGAEAIEECALEDCIAKLRQCNPKTVFLVGSFMYDDGDYAAIKRACHKHGAILAFWFHDDPFEFDYSLKYAPLADIVFSCDRHALTFLGHSHAYHLPTAADGGRATLAIRKLKDRRIDFFFCGVGFPHRVRVLKACRRILSRYNTVVLGAEWPESLEFCTNLRIKPHELMALYSDAKITLNIGRQFDLANSIHRLSSSTPGPRTFESAMAGTVQAYFVDGLEIGDYLEIDTEILLFNDGHELEDIYADINGCPDRYHRMALAARERVLREHTYRNRAAYALEKVRMLDSHQSATKTHPTPNLKGSRQAKETVPSL